MKKLLLFCLIPALLLAQGVRRETLRRSSVSGTYAAATIAGGMISLTSPSLTKGSKGYTSYVVGTTDTINTSNSVRLFFFADTAGFGAITSGAAFVMSDTMAVALRGTMLLNFNVLGASGNSWSEVQKFQPYVIPPGKKLYVLPVMEVAGKFKYLTGKLRLLFTFDDF